MKEYTENKINENTFIRTFDANAVHELPWHRDAENRKIEVLSAGDGWHYQEDNCLPVLLVPGLTISIQKLVFHRLIKGKGQLKIKVSKEV